MESLYCIVALFFFLHNLFMFSSYFFQCIFQCKDSFVFFRWQWFSLLTPQAHTSGVEKHPKHFELRSTHTHQEEGTPHTPPPWILNISFAHCSLSLCTCILATGERYGSLRCKDQREERRRRMSGRHESRSRVHRRGWCHVICDVDPGAPTGGQRGGRWRMTRRSSGTTGTESVSHFFCNSFWSQIKSRR